jgi:hypothetical protein
VEIVIGPVVDGVISNHATFVTELPQIVPGVVDVVVST